MKALTIPALLLIAAFIFSCTKETTAFTDIPVIESYLLPGDSFVVKVTRQVPFIDDATYASDDIAALSLSVTVNGEEILMRAKGDGEYVAINKLVPNGGEITLDFSYNQKKVHAYTYLPSAPTNFTSSVTSITMSVMDTSRTFTPGTAPVLPTMPDPIELSWTNSDASNYLVLVENMENNPELIRELPDNVPNPARFRKQPTTGSTEELRAQEFQYFGKHRIILYHVLPDYATLYDQNSNSSQNLTNPSTSITNGYGIFTGLHADTIFVTVYKKD